MNETTIRFNQKLSSVTLGQKHLIDRFIGVDITDIDNVNFGFVMPIIEKINAMDDFAHGINVYYCFTDVIVDDVNDSHKSVTTQIEGNSMLEAAFNAIIFFIEWYNKNILKL